MFKTFQICLGQDPHPQNGDAKPSSHGPNFFGLRILLLWMSGFLAVALFALCVLYSSDWPQSATMLIWSFGICAVGAIIGFLFAIPRVVSDSIPPPARTTQPEVNSPLELTLIDEVKRHRLAANTNLEQVSDWLTKIIVGVGLIELNEIPTLVNRLAALMSIGFGDAPASLSVATAVIVLFSAGGFLIGYVTTRAFLPHILQAAEENAVAALLSRLRHAKPKAEAANTQCAPAPQPEAGGHSSSRTSG
ncbi:hypothetical protein [Lacipirellula parvula]|uniref:Uncharacterized protein n=1 Tax=Lacipirellula parvula TaxID=2650471 RepID=A0A5K7XA11_9BACT|nr:hypothetical protein [Lacipirellula parvula]BBO33245.1 hypothetical protein PLANPX_2857 [Lacipirellula parvula]